MPSFNTESKIIINDDKVTKVFENQQNYYIEGKKKIIDDLLEIKDIIDLEELVYPISYSYSPFSYTMPYIEGQTLNKYLESSISYDKKINILFQLGNFIERLDKIRKKRNITFYINDLHSSNILIDKYNNIKIIDLDSARTKSNIKMPSLYLNQSYYSKMYNLDKYEKINYNVVANYNAEIYSYIMIILKFLTGIEFYAKREPDYNFRVKELKEKGLDINLYNSFISVYQEKETINPYKYLKKMI